MREQQHTSGKPSPLPFPKPPFPTPGGVDLLFVVSAASKWQGSPNICPTPPAACTPRWAAFRLDAFLGSVIPPPYLPPRQVGGNGGNAGANAIQQKCAESEVVCNVIGVPKSIDNDILLIDKCFGFDTAVEEAQRALLAAKVGPVARAEEPC